MASSTPQSRPATGTKKRELNDSNTPTTPTPKTGVGNTTQGGFQTPPSMKGGVPQGTAFISRVAPPATTSDPHTVASRRSARRALNVIYDNPPPRSVQGKPGKTFNNVGNLMNLTRDQLIQEILKRQGEGRRIMHGDNPDWLPGKSWFRRYSKIDLISELTTILSPEERNALGERKRKDADAKREALERFKRATEAKALKKAADEAEKERKVQKAADEAEKERKVQKAAAQTKRAVQHTAGLSVAMAAAAVETAKASMNRNAQEYKEQMQLALKKAKNAERAKTKQKEANLHKYAGLMTMVKKNKQIANRNEKLALMKAEKNKQLTLATKKMEEIMTKAGKRDNFSKKNILDFISKSAKSNNKLTKKDILEFLSKQKTPTVTVKQSIGNVKAEGGKANVQIVNSKKLNREARLDQNIKRRDANYRRIVTADPMALKRQKRVFAKKRGELLKSIQKIIKSDRKTNPKIKKKVYDSYVKSPRDRISKLLKLPKKELITMIKRSTSRISK